jgi:hypothetical protein
MKRWNFAVVVAILWFAGTPGSTPVAQAGTYFTKGSANKVIGKFSFADKTNKQDFFFINSDFTNSVRVYLQPLEPELKRDLSDKLHYSVCLKFAEDCDNRCNATVIKVLEVLDPGNPGVTKYSSPTPCP